MKTARLLEKLRKEFGFPTLDAMYESAITDGTCPGICEKCEEYTTEYEPDQDAGFCEECETNTVVSCLILAGI